MLGLNGLPPDTGDSGLPTAMLLRATAGGECTAGKHSNEGPAPLGDTEEALRMLVRTATSFSASTLQQYRLGSVARRGAVCDAVVNDIRFPAQGTYSHMMMMRGHSAKCQAL